MRKLLFALLTLILVSCQEKEFNIEVATDYQVSKEKIKIIANSFDFKQTNLKSKTVEDKEVSEIYEISGDDKTLLYVVNFKDNKGFTIFTADTRAYPVIAHSSEGKFDLLESWSRSNRVVRIPKNIR